MGENKLSLSMKHSLQYGLMIHGFSEKCRENLAQIDNLIIQVKASNSLFS